MSVVDEFDLKVMQDKCVVCSVIDVYVVGWKSCDYNMVNCVYLGVVFKCVDMCKYCQVDVIVGDCDIQFFGGGVMVFCFIIKLFVLKKGDLEMVRLCGFQLIKSGSDWCIVCELQQFVEMFEVSGFLFLFFVY